MSEKETFFDAVLDDAMMPVFNGTPEETLDWLKANPDAQSLRVCPGQSLRVIPAKEYMAKAESSS